MRVAFISGNREKLPDPVVPLGIVWLASSLPKRHAKIVVDLCFEEAPFAYAGRRLEVFRPDVVAIGMRNIQSADYSGTTDNVAYYTELLETVRATTDAPIVMGGSGFSVMPDRLMQELRPDYGIAGEAEESFPALIEALERGRGFEQIGSLHRFVGDALVSNPPPAHFLEMDRLPLPDRSLVDPRHYTEHGIEAIQTKRGCPLHCEYCTYPLIEGRVGRVRPPSAVVDEIESLLATQPGLRHLFIVDSVFNLPRRHAAAVCREMIERDVSIPWTCYVNPLGFNAELAELMAAAGCAGMEVGADSGSDRLLDALGKGFTTGQIRELSRLAKAAGLRDCHTFLLGTPGETLDDVERTLDFIIDLDPFGAILMAWVDDYEALDPRLAKERRVLREALLERLREHSGKFPWWSIPSLGVNYDPALFDLLRRRGCHGPLWQHMRGSGELPSVRRSASSAEVAPRVQPALESDTAGRRRRDPDIDL